MNFYDEEIEEVISKLETSSKGLSSDEVEIRLQKFGKNKLKDDKKKSKFARFLDQFKDMMIFILIIAAVVSGISSYLSGESYTDTIVILAVVFINAIMGFIQELKAEEAVENLKAMTTPFSKVIRNGSSTIIASEDLVPGDIVELEAGDRVPADCRIIWSAAASVDESMLTGESEPAQKSADKVASGVVLNDRSSMIYSGCNVVYGRIKAVVTGTGMDTELGKIASSIQSDKEVLSPLQLKINNISKVLSFLIAILIGIMLVYGIVVKNGILETIMLCISLAVAAIPEGLPAVITVTLSLGTTSMAKKNTIVRKMSSVETLGSLDIICSDKTGTITQNRMTVKEIIYNSKSFKTEREPIENSDLFIKMMVLCNDTKVDVEDVNNLIGDPTETALFKYARDFGYNPEKIVENCTRIGEKPFDSDRKMMTTVNDIDGQKVVITKGGMDALFDRCIKYYENGEIRDINPEYRKLIRLYEKEMAARSLRVLAFGYKLLNKDADVNDTDHFEEDLIFVGLVGMIDPPRDTVKASISTCKQAGIMPVMITGDSLATATAIAKEIGIVDNVDQGIEGKELDKFTDEEMKDVVQKYRVYARVQPEHKVRIVKAWQANGKVVAMTGDGVNDAPAIKLAHVGIGMGKTGTEVTKGVADVVLVDDSFSTIVDAVKEGRKIYDNIRNDIVYYLSSNFAEIIVVLVSLFFKFTVLLPLHILYVDLVTDSIPSIALAFEKEADGIMKRKPKKSNAPFFTPYVIGMLAVSAIIEAVAVLFTYKFGVSQFGEAVGQTMAFLCLIIQEMTFAYNCRNLKDLTVKQGFFSNKAMNIGTFALILIQLLVFCTPVGKILGIARLTLKPLLLILGLNIVAFLIIDFSKLVMRKVFKDE